MTLVWRFATLLYPGNQLCLGDWISASSLEWSDKHRLKRSLLEKVKNLPAECIMQSRQTREQKLKVCSAKALLTGQTVVLKADFFLSKGKEQSPAKSESLN